MYIFNPYLVCKVLLQRLVLLAMLAACQSVWAADLTVTIKGIQGNTGRLYVALHSDAMATEFPAESSRVSGIWRMVRGDTMRVVFADLPPGRYAVSAYHDADNDQRMNTNLLGVPTEAAGFSNDAAGMMGPPDFDDAAVVVDKDLSIAIALSG